MKKYMFQKARVATLAVVLLLAGPRLTFAQSNELSGLLQKGLFEEEARHDLNAAVTAYEAAVAQHDKDRQLAATAIFRLGECYRKLGKADDANRQYSRILREFPDQADLAKLSRDYVGGEAAGSFQRNLEKIVGQAASATPSEAADAMTTSEAEEIRQIRELVQNSPDLVNRPAPGSLSSIGPLQKAAQEGHVRVAQFLLDNGAQVDPHNGEPPLVIACRAGNKTMAELLLSRGAEVNSPTGNAPLFAAAEKGFKTVVDLLLAHKADVNARNTVSTDNRDWTALHIAAQQGFVSVAERLLSAGAEVNAKAADGRTPLHVAAIRGQGDVLNLLLAHYAELEARTDSGMTPLWSAMNGNALSTASILLAHGASVEAEDNRMQNETVSGYRPLLGAIQRGMADWVELLLTNHANPNVKWEYEYRPSTPPGGPYSPSMRAERHHRTPLLQAVQNDSPSNSNHQRFLRIIGLLLDHGADPNTPDETGMTPLHYAVRFNNRDAVDLLIAHHADANARDDQGNPPLAYATGVIADALRSAGADADFVRRHSIVFKRGDTLVLTLREGTNTWGTPTLMEVFANCNWIFDQNRLSFPDLDHVSVNRLDAGGVKSVSVSAHTILASGDPRQDFQLHWGDEVQIPETDHLISERWDGPSTGDGVWRDLMLSQPGGDLGADGEPLVKIDRRTITLTINGSKHDVQLVPLSGHPYNGPQLPRPMLPGGMPGLASGGVTIPTRYPTAPRPSVFASSSPAPGTVVGPGPSGERFVIAAGSYSGAWPTNQPNAVILLQSGFALKSVLSASGQLRSSSDDAHIKVRRKDPQTGEVRERIFNCSANSPLVQNEDAGLSNYPWLHDGDEVEVPEKTAQ